MRKPHTASAEPVLQRGLQASALPPRRMEASYWQEGDAWLRSSSTVGKRHAKLGPRLPGEWWKWLFGVGHEFIQRFIYCEAGVHRSPSALLDQGPVVLGAVRTHKMMVTVLESLDL